jgi:cyanophycinase
VEDFQHHGVTAALIDVNFRAPQEAANPERAADIRAHRSIWFTGGDQSRIINAFRPDDGDTVGYEALWSVLDADGAIGGTSAGAAMMSDPCIRWGNSAEALLVGFSEVEDRGVRVGKGMGFFPYGITDQHFIRRGRLGRMIMAQVLTDMQFGFGVEENRGLQVDLETHELTAVGGDRAILIADIGEIQTNGLAHEGIRITLLSDGDTMHGLRHTVTVNPLSTRKPLNTTEWNGNQVLHEGQAWEANRLVDLMATMAILGLRTATTSDDNFDLTFTVDERTRFYLAPDTGGPDRADISVVDIRLDITPKAHAAEARQALLIEISSGGMGN